MKKESVFTAQNCGWNLSSSAHSATFSICYCYRLLLFILFCLLHVAVGRRAHSAMTISYYEYYTQPYYNNMPFYPRKSTSFYNGLSFATVCLVYFKLFIPIVIFIFRLAQHRDIVPTDIVFMISHCACTYAH